MKSISPVSRALFYNIVGEISSMFGITVAFFAPIILSDDDKSFLIFLVSIFGDFGLFGDPEAFLFDYNATFAGAILLGDADAFFAFGDTGLFATYGAF